MIGETWRSLSRNKSHWSSQVAAPNALYSDSYEDLETVNCFLVLQEISDFPRKKNWPEIDLLESIHPAQSASEKPEIYKGESMGKKRP